MTEEKFIKAPLFDDETTALEPMGEPLPIGHHVFKVYSAEHKITEAKPEENKGARQTVWARVEIVESDNPEHVGRKGVDFWEIPNKEHIEKYGSSGRNRKFWKLVHQADPKAAGKEGVNIERLVGLQFRATVYEEEWQGKKRPRMTNYVFMERGTVAASGEGLDDGAALTEG